MRKELFIFGISLLFVFVGFSGCVGLGPEVTEYFNDVYNTDESTVLKVGSINGDIEIYTWDNDTVKFDAVKRSRYGRDELDMVEIIVNEDGNVIDISTKYTGTGNVRVSVDMNIKVPDYVVIDSAFTSNGAVQLSGTKGDTSVSSSNGAIVLENVNGFVDAKTSNGNIDIKGCSGVRDIESSNGRLFVEIFDFNDDVKIKTSNGRINVYINTSLNADIEMETSNGDIDVSGVTLNLTESGDKYMVGKLGSGGDEINIQTSNGDINLFKLDV